MAVRIPVETYTDTELQETVAVEVTHNNESRTFTVLRVLLCTYAPSFASTFKLSSVRAFKIEDVPIEMFNVFLGWLRMEYFRQRWTDKDPWYDDPKWIAGAEGSDRYHSDCDPLMSDGLESDVWHYAETAIEMFIFAEAFDIPRLRQDAIDRLVWCHNYEQEACTYGEFVPTSAIRNACEHTKEGSPLRKILIRGFHSFSNQEDEDLKGLPAEFLVDVLGLIRDNKYGDGDPLTACDYHDHPTEKERLDCDMRVWLDRRNIEDA